MRHYIFLMICILLGVASSGYAQKTKKVHGEYIYHAPENVSLEQAKKTALSRAQIQALGDVFGSVVGQHNATMLSNTNGSTHTDLPFIFTFFIALRTSLPYSCGTSTKV